jgi:hypothetical protein
MAVASTGAIILETAATFGKAKRGIYSYQCWIRIQNLLQNFRICV